MGRLRNVVPVVSAIVVPVVPIRSLLGPVMVAAAVWAASGSLTLAADDPAVRLAVPASPLWILTGLVAALLVPAWRRCPWIAAPALLAVLPWLPAPLPAVLLVWTGPMAWAPIGFALSAALMAQPASRKPSAAARGVAAHVVAAGLVTFVAGGLVLNAVRGRVPGGDEPHYLIIAQSLLKDGDLRIENNHANRDYAEYWGGNLAPHVLQTGRGGEIYSIHAPGVAVLVAPLFALFGLIGAQLTVLVVVSMAGALVWLAGWYATADRGAAWFSWAAVMGSATMLVQSVTIFPDGPGAAITAAAAVVWLRISRGARVTTPVLVGTSALLASLPFLHTRFVVLAAGLGLAIAHAIWIRNRPFALWRLGAFFAIPGVGAIGWFGYFLILYGTPNPMIAYGANSESSLTYVPGGIAGLLFDQQFGLVSFSPVLMLALAGWLSRSRAEHAPRVWPLGAVACVYLATVATYWMWWAGVPATPARLATSVLPLLAAPLALAWRDGSPARRTIALTLLGSSAGVSLLLFGVDAGRLAWSSRDAQASWLWTLGPVVDLPRGAPSFFWRLVGGDVSSEWPFARHVLVWAVTFAGVAAAFRAVARTRDFERDRSVALASGVLPLALMAALGAGWWLNGVPAVRPAPSQTAFLRAMASGARAFAIAPGRVSAVQAGSAPVHITIPRVNLPGTPAVWAGLRDVPAGDFDLRLTARRPSGGTLSVRTGFSRAPIEVISLPRQSVHTMRLSLPVGTTDLAFIPDDALAAGQGTLVLSPQVLLAGPYRPARARLQVDGIDVHVVGGGPFVEDRALWVRGEGRADLVLSAPDRSQRITEMRVVNGPVANQVDLVVAADTRRLDLAASATVTVPVSVPASGTVAVSVASRSGFRPSDDGQNSDGRLLGVRVEFGGAPGGTPPIVDQ